MITAKNVEVFMVTTQGGSMSLRMANDDYLETLREFIDFINQQVGVYMDALSGFSGNKARIELQKARVQRRFYKGKDTDGANIITATSFEDPSRPEIIQHRIIRAVDYIAANASNGFNEQQQARAIIVFLFAYWDEEIRPRLARAKNLASPNDIRVDAMGDLRLLRNAIIHNKGVLAKVEYQKLKVLKELFSADTELLVPYESMHQIFVRAKQGVGILIVEHAGKRPGAPESDEIKNVAIQRLGKID